jgi:hypothetical protein
MGISYFIYVFLSYVHFSGTQIWYKTRAVLGGFGEKAAAWMIRQHFGQDMRIFSSPKRLYWLLSPINLSTVNWTQTLPFLLYGFRQFPHLIVILLPQENSYFVGDDSAVGTFLFALVKNNSNFG